MRLLEDLVLRVIGTNGYKKRYGLYECPVCNKCFETMVEHVKSGKSTKCRECADKLNAKAQVEKASSNFMEKAKAIHGDLYNYTSFIYNGAHNKSKFGCRVHGTFEQTPNSHLSGRGCQKCAAEGRANAQSNKSATEFVDKAKAIHGGKYDYKSFKYNCANTKGAIRCNGCGSVFLQRPSDHLNGCGCPHCASAGFNKSKPAIVYYLKIAHKDTVVYKIGITNRTVQERFNNTDLEKIQVIKTWDYLIGVEAYVHEQQILKEYKDYKYTGEPLLSSGNTELFTVDILGLDYDYSLSFSYHSSLYSNSPSVLAK